MQCIVKKGTDSEQITEETLWKEHTAMEDNSEPPWPSLISAWQPKVRRTEPLQAWCKADLVFAHAWTLHTWQFNSQSSETPHIASPHACLHHRPVIEELSLKSRSTWFRITVGWLLCERLLERSMMTSLTKNESSVDVHSSSSCSEPIYVLSFMKEKRRYLGECSCCSFTYNKGRQWSVAFKHQKRKNSQPKWWPGDNVFDSRVVDCRWKANIYDLF